MPVIAVINRKGGSGKSTLATHLAAYCAREGKRVMLGDVDRQQSAQGWLKLRGEQKLTQGAPIQGWALDPKNVLRVPAGVTHVVLDTPGGMRGFELARIVMNADVILMPVCNSMFDRDSAAECYAELKALPRVASGRCKVGAIGMRLDARTKAAEVLAQWARKVDLPFIGVLRETQVYVRSIELGLTLFDLPAVQVKGDLAQWQPILQWLDPVLNPQAAAAAAKADPTTAMRAEQVPISLMRTESETASAAHVEQEATLPARTEQKPATLKRAVPKPATLARTDAAIAPSRAEPATAKTLRADDGTAPVKPLRESRPVIASSRTAPRPAVANASERATPSERTRPVLQRPQPARPATLSKRIEQLLDTLPIPRFLQRNP